MDDLGKMLFNTILVFLPAYLANMMPLMIYSIPIAKPLFKYRIDFGYKLGREDLFGKNKTWAGLISGVIGGLVGGYIMFLIVFTYFPIGNDDIYKILLNDMIYGVIIGFGALIGDLVKSFLKRRLTIKSGKPWWIFDQIDFILGAYIFSFLIFPIPIVYFVIALIITPLLHLGMNVIAFKLKLKKVWW